MKTFYSGTTLKTDTNYRISEVIVPNSTFITGFDDPQKTFVDLMSKPSSSVFPLKLKRIRDM